MHANHPLRAQRLCCAALLCLFGMSPALAVPPQGPALGAFVGLFAWLLPLSPLLLVLSRCWQRRRVRPGYCGCSDCRPAAKRSDQRLLQVHSARPSPCNKALRQSSE